jgi:hypothetical protein
VKKRLKVPVLLQRKAVYLNLKLRALLQVAQSMGPLPP